MQNVKISANVTTFTIDPKDAKDFDDALSIRLIKPGLWEVGVHIADVTHYVKEGSVIDKEAENARYFRLSGRPYHPHVARTAV